MNFRKTYAFDDVLLVPQFSDVRRRADVDTSTTVAGIPLKLPIIAANMSSVCEVEMCVAMHEIGGLGIIHRMCSPEEQQKMLMNVKGRWRSANVGFSIGVGSDWKQRMDLCSKTSSIVCLDIAHAHSKHVLELLDIYFKEYELPIIIGQVSTWQAVLHISRIIPDEWKPHVAFKPSIGGGSLCTTRIKTGFGIPTLQAVVDIYEHRDVFSTSIIADGGIKNSGDIVKSLAAGASAVMLGNLLAGTDEAPGRAIYNTGGPMYKVYRGSASFSDKSLRGEETRNIEGEETRVPYKGSVKTVISDLMDGVRSGFSYAGSSNLQELQENAEFVVVTSAGFRESQPHGKLV